mmetsp:Transcript_5790/g.17669  ORF Transcript_5790/g.17669 Transcript_5790/m.17669 type:complete len:230 (-) Transcript_5790:484-1173(-)|eukprot:351732-Chlamydomonas_euryale.AAC.20
MPSSASYHGRVASTPPHTSASLAGSPSMNLRCSSTSSRLAALARSVRSISRALDSTAAIILRGTHAHSSRSSDTSFSFFRNSRSRTLAVCTYTSPTAMPCGGSASLSASSSALCRRISARTSASVRSSPLASSSPTYASGDMDSSASYRPYRFRYSSTGFSAPAMHDSSRARSACTGSSIGCTALSVGMTAQKSDSITLGSSCGMPCSFVTAVSNRLHIFGAIASSCVE